MKKVIRLTEQDLVRLVKRVIQEGESFSLGDKLNMGVSKALHGEEGIITSVAKKLGKTIFDKVSVGEFELGDIKSALEKVSSYKNKFVPSKDPKRWFCVEVNLNGGTYTVLVANIYTNEISYIITPEDEVHFIFFKNFTNRLITNILKHNPQADPYYGEKNYDEFPSMNKSLGTGIYSAISRW